MPSPSPFFALLRPRADDQPLVQHSATLTVLQIFRTFWPRLRTLRWWLLLSLMLSVIPALIAVAEIALFERLVDDVLVPADLGPFPYITAIYVGLNLLAAVVDGADDYLGTWISQRFLTTLRRDAFAHVLALPAHRLDHLRLGDVMSRLTSDIGTVESFMVRHLTWGFRQAATLIIYVAALLWMDLLLALAAMVVVPLFFWAATRFAEYTKSASRERRRRAGSLSAITEEHLANAALVQGYNQEATAIARYERQNVAIMDAELVASRVRAVFLPMVGLFELLGVLVVIGLGVWALATQRMTLGEVLAFLALLGSCYRPVRDLGNLLPSLFAATAGIERVQELLDEPTMADPPHAVALPAEAAGVALRNVHARYPGRDVDAVHDLDLTIEPGERVAVVGGSGAGKTTLTRLLDGSLQPHSGTVRLGDNDLALVTRESIRASVAVVAQEMLLSDATVAENIAFGEPGATRADIVAAARRADAHDFITRLPDGYDTRIGQRGRTLSGGQRQRLNVARGLLHGGGLLILDEPTTGLDPAGAHRLMRSLTEHRDRSLLILTHDPVVLDHVDRVIELPAVESVGTRLITSASDVR
ncbi:MULTISPECIES: ABC transporter ATP-binding protein [unclassified Gordonia (in: high G+C Gram-positive bacteria)]|uniref:ABC transporter ATP-binding protein n=1 Tax=Gordonia TaxID=2053 RepID=UPI001595F09A|nr:MULTISPECIES: ABC transporter ATP-binding protein [unclassified Gordonia (in: high G+C Gram-positive bacteria)]MCX2753389.1 ABC transporter ATP-binding protein [Gordonia sp. 4N]MDT0219580.1 ABC transporter ATP-binding protein [Gordonia sp. AC31]